MAMRSRSERIASVAVLDDPTRRAMFDFVAASGSAVTRDVAAEALHLSRRVAALHLDKLADHGLLTVEYRRLNNRTGPGAGRPAKLYRCSSGEVAVSVPERHYDLIGELFVAAVAQTMDTGADIAATLLYPVTARPFRELYELACTWSERQRAEVIDVALRSRTRRDEILAGFRGGLYAYDFVMDIGAFRDLHRHRRCQKFRQAYNGNLGFDTPKLVTECGASEVYAGAMQSALDAMRRLPAGPAEYLLTFGSRSRFLFKMDFAEAEYISRLRSGVKGHFSYREIAWEMKVKMEQLEPELGRLIDATPPWVEDPLKR